MARQNLVANPHFAAGFIRSPSSWSSRRQLAVLIACAAAPWALIVAVASVLP